MVSVPAPLLVALHGCTQTAADFAAGSRFDPIAERVGAFVLYPEQMLRANPRRCWNWFSRKNQVRGGGEPAAILELVEQVCRRYPIDRERIFVAGPSAGGAMAAILAEQAPDVFAAAGIAAGGPLHSGVDIGSALRTLKGQIPEEIVEAMVTQAPYPAPAYDHLRVTIWTGVEDKLVNPENSTLLARQFVKLFRMDEARTTVETRDDASLTRWYDARKCVRVELWRVEAMGHLWSGGSFRGSHTYPPGPPSSELMMRYFLDGSLRRTRLEAPRK